MTNWLERVRGAVGLGLTWAVSWFAIGALVAVLPGTMPAGIPIVLEWVVGFAAQFAALGFVGGAAFSVVLRVTEGRRRLDQMSLPRFAAWGAFGRVVSVSPALPVAVAQPRPAHAIRASCRLPVRDMPRR